MKTGQNRRNGSVLVIVVISMVAATTAGLAILSVATSSRYERIGLGSTGRAYYLAESGADFVRAQRATNPTVLPSGTFTLSNGDQFIVAASTNSNGRVIVSSIGIASPGTALEARMTLSFNIRARVDPRLLDLGFDNDDNGLLDQEWQFTPEGADSTGTPQIGTPPEGGDALKMENWMGNFQLNWSSNTNLDLVKAWSNNTRLLSYDVQAKVSAAKNDGYPTNPVFNSILLVGIGFRLQTNKLSGYGLSFYRFHPDFQRNSPWTNDLGSTFLTTLRNTNVYLTLWSRAYPGKRTVIAYKKLSPGNVLYPSPIQSGQYDIKPFSTLLVQLKEEWVGATTNRINKITVYMQSTNLYPRWPDGIRNYVYAKWQNETNIFPAPVAWDFPAGTTVVTNSLFTTANFNILKSPEINLHVYDYATKFFDDFVMRAEGFMSDKLPGSQIQY